MARTAPSRDRSRLLYKAAYALRRPGRVPRYARRSLRDAMLRARYGRDHVAYYRAVMASDSERSAESAVGGPTSSREAWLRIGKWQYEYLLAHGLKPADRLLEIGCGNLRAGWRLMRYLEPGHYYGIDISPHILLSAKDTVVRYGLQDRLPHLTLTDNLSFDFLPADHFTVIHAHSVFSHTPLEVIEECFEHVGRILAPGGFFDLTFDRTEGREHHVLREDFYYRTETLAALAARHGLSAELMADWEAMPHGQSKLRIRADR
ncbi:class I SAM-dependent methyltransferase [Streptomyces sp. A7024]|uniref:Class I SAM-dependent methyltransferase n=1 Tax=Streptomyces coryli TaxID=1128680 RepID=A0A6G4TXH9_9ACTN|nr:class I SAM-dependent methyltransferase [Streptomyces coryli]NGN63711.1 class I SAM-dependent methyltransferase [Streptomyces coryli]